MNKSLFTSSPGFKLFAKVTKVATQNIVKWYYDYNTHCLFLSIIGFKSFVISSMSF